MTDWTIYEEEKRPSLAHDILVDVLYEDDAAYTNLAAGYVEWSRTKNLLVLWRLSRIIVDDR